MAVKVGSLNQSLVVSARPYQMCTRCVMDTTDPDIQFDEKGVCNHCRKYEALARTIFVPENERQRKLDRLVQEIKIKGKGKEYDCVIGVSGGVDSTYVAYLVKKLGLRPLAVHMDNGWDSELAVNNIEQFLAKLDIDLYTVVLDWEEFKDLQCAFLNASVSDAEIPTDHAIGGSLYQVADDRDVPYIIMGTNFATEGILPVRWTYGIDDWRYIKSVHERFGRGKLRSYPHYGFFHKLYYLVVKRIRTINILDYVSYNKQEVMRVLQEGLGWQYYGGKHYESIYTRFFQGYILPRKFNIDKRKAHLSALIMSGQVTREDALQELKRPPYTGYMQEADMEYVLKKLELTEEEFGRIMSLPVKTYEDYPTYLSLRKIITVSRVDQVARKLGAVPVDLT